MKRTLAFALLAAALTLLAGACAKAPVTGKNELSKRFFDAWVSINYPNAPETALGSRIISDRVGAGEVVGSNDDAPFVYALYTVTDLGGNISATTDKRLCQQIGSYNETHYYGPYVVCRKQGYLSAGADEVITSMRVGGARTAAIPGWLTSTGTDNYYSTAKEYLDNVTGSDILFNIEIVERIPNIAKWETDSLARYMARHYPGVDSTSYGYYYIQTVPPKSTADFENSTTVYVNYTGRNLTGQVFDSTIQDTTKRYRIFKDGKTYEPMSLTWPSSEEGSVTTESGGSLVEGFARCVKAMHAGEKGICFFYSGLGYGITGSGGAIPPCSPLIFEIEMLGKNEDGSIDEEDTED